MPPTEAQKRAANKYNKEHMATIGCKVKKDESVKFKAYAESLGKTTNTVLREYVLKCINDSIPHEESQATPVSSTTPDIVAVESPKPKAVSKSTTTIRAITPEAAESIDRKRLLSDIGYQIDIASTYGTSVLSSLLEDARQQEIAVNTTASE